MNVYVESNFVLELALVQEQHASCERILTLCEAGDIRVVVPAYSIVEPYETLLRRHLGRKGLKDSLDLELQQLSRTSGYAQRLSGFEALTALLVDSAKEEIQRLERIRARLLSCATVIELEASILSSASQHQERHDLSTQDAIVYASVLFHLGSVEDGAKSCFLTRDTDFDDPSIMEGLRVRRCKVIWRFDDGLSYLSAGPREVNP
ncbi:MAG TPA: PIN domain-containing protein [Thermoanaerobaculia bacterium]